MKSYGGLWPRITAFGNLVGAVRLAARGTRRTHEVQSFLYDLESGLLGLKRELDSGIYAPGAYRTFLVRDSKRRRVSVAPFRDRVVHHAVCDVLEPILERIYADPSFACRKGRGTHMAVSAARRHVRRVGCFLKCDIRKFFDSVDHDILLQNLERSFREKPLLDVLERIVRNPVPGCSEGRGLAIGNLTSQHFANLLLTELDLHVLHRLRPAGYVRYMDDFVLFEDDMDVLHGHLYEIRAFLGDRLDLRLKPGATFAAPCSHGLPFLGVQIFPSVTRMNGKSLRRLERKLAWRMVERATGEIDGRCFERSLNSIFGHLSHADSLVLRRDICHGMRVAGE